jgi:thiol-disulfide isomerase/thioredoxin
LQIRASIGFLYASHSISPYRCVDTTFFAASVQANDTKEDDRSFDRWRGIAPALVAGDFDVKTHSLAEFKERVVMLNFWAGWRPPSIEELPMLHNLPKQPSARGVRVVDVSSGEAPGKVERAIKRFELDNPQRFDEYENTRGKWQVGSLPTSVVIGLCAKAQFVSNGAREDVDLPEIKNCRRVA